MQLRSPCIGRRYNGSAPGNRKKHMAPRHAQRHDKVFSADRLRSIADGGTPAAVFTAAADIFPKAIIPAAATDIVALARSAIAAGPHRIVAWPRVGTGDAKAEHGTDGHASGNGPATTGSGGLTPTRGCETQHQRRDSRCLN